MRAEKNWPEDPTSYMIDYFGNERSALWEDMAEMEEENDKTNAMIPDLKLEIT